MNVARKVEQKRNLGQKTLMSCFQHQQQHSLILGTNYNQQIIFYIKEKALLSALQKNQTKKATTELHLMT